MSRSLLIVLVVLASPMPLAAQTLQFSAEWNVSVAIDAQRAKQNPNLAKAIEGAVGIFGGSVGLATLTDTVSIERDHYRLNSLAKAGSVIAAFLPDDSATRASEGYFGGGYPMTVKFSERRGKGEPRTANVDYQARVLNYFKSGKIVKRESMSYRTTDSGMLPYAFFRQALPTGTSTLAATDGMSTRIFVLDPRVENFTLNGQTLQAVKFTSRISSQQNAGLELWVRKSDGFPLRVRLNLNAKYGAVLDQRLSAIPAALR